MSLTPIPFLDLVTPHLELEEELVAVLRNALKTAGFYKEWREKFGEDAWKTLEKYSGALS